jgi:peptidoglycan/xylan/chitin deacetylase (PgdA/CDA1 family)
MREADGRRIRVLDALSIIVAALILGTFAAFVWTCLDESRRPRLICLMYHRFATSAAYDALRGTERVFTVTVERFDEQLRFLKEHGFHPVTVSEAAEFVAGTRELPDRPVLLTIDDGSLSVRTWAEPVLRRHGVPAVLFVTTDPDAHVFEGGGERRRLTDEELSGMDPAVIEVESHGHTHRPLVTLPDDELRDELRRGRNELRRVTGRSVDYLAIPGNWHDGRVRRFAEDAGFRGVFVSDAGTNPPRGDTSKIRRLNVEGCAGIAEFEKSLTPGVIAQIRFVSALKRLPGRLIGPRLWLPLRSIIRSFVSPEMLSFRSLRIAALGATVIAVVVLVFWWFVQRGG